MKINKDNRLQWSAVFAFAGLIAAVFVLNKMKGRQVLRARRILSARRRAYQGRVNPIARRQHGLEQREIAMQYGLGQKELAMQQRSDALTKRDQVLAQRRAWDEMSGTSRYSRDFLGGRLMGAHPHLA